MFFTGHMAIGVCFVAISKFQFHRRGSHGRLKAVISLFTCMSFFWEVVSQGRSLLYYVVHSWRLKLWRLKQALVVVDCLIKVTLATLWLFTCMILVLILSSPQKHFPETPPALTECSSHPIDSIWRRVHSSSGVESDRKPTWIWQSTTPLLFPHRSGFACRVGAETTTWHLSINSYGVY